MTGTAARQPGVRANEVNAFVARTSMIAKPFYAASACLVFGLCSPAARADALDFTLMGEGRTYAFQLSSSPNPSGGINDAVFAVANVIITVDNERTSSLRKSPFLLNPLAVGWTSSETFPSRWTSGILRRSGKTDVHHRGLQSCEQSRRCAVYADN
jgi:hypothetical protein